MDETHVSLQHMSGPILEDWVEEYAGVPGKKEQTSVLNSLNYYYPTIVYPSLDSITQYRVYF